jgi:Fe-S-cluster containining protein
MDEEYRKLITTAKDSRKQLNQTFKKLSKKKTSELTSIFSKLHNSIFPKYDCLKCANCCKTAGPIVLPKDVERICSFFKMDRKKFEAEYLKIDEDGDVVFKSLPCPFLQDDNYCLIYEARPKACREYPHTDRKMTKELLGLTKKNCRICPPLAEMAEKLKDNNF